MDIRMPVNHLLLSCVFATLFSASIAVPVRSDELSEKAGDASAAETRQPAKRWYTNLDEAKLAANASRRPIMIVFR